VEDFILCLYFRGIFHQNCLKTAPIQSNIDYADFESPLVEF
jgi:hypothetical protein